jgi:hypothetical protein
MESLFSQGEAGVKRKLRIRCDRATKKELKDLNVDAGMHFARRYAGVKALFGDRVTWNVGQLFDFPKLMAECVRNSRAPLNRSTAKAAIQLKFVLEFEVDVPCRRNWWMTGTVSPSTHLSIAARIRSRSAPRARCKLLTWRTSRRSSCIRQGSRLVRERLQEAK